MCLQRLNFIDLAICENSVTKFTFSVRKSEREKTNEGISISSSLVPFHTIHYDVIYKFQLSRQSGPNLSVGWLIDS